MAALARVVEKRRSVSGEATLRLGELPRPEVLPASYGQQSLWLIEQLGGPGGRYVVPLVLRLSGDLDQAALLDAVQDVVARHEALRTLLVEDEGSLRQVVLSPEQAARALNPLNADLNIENEDHRTRTMDAWVAGILRRTFDLAKDLPIRAGLLRVDSAEWVFVLAAHHHAVDEWSFPSLLGDLATAYRARAEGERPHWVPLPVQYADYALWQREVLGSGDDADSLLGQDLAYWREVLADAPQESTITLDRARPNHPTHHGVDLSFTVDAVTVDGLRRVAAAQGVSMFMIAQAATALAASCWGPVTTW